MKKSLLMFIMFYSAISMAAHDGADSKGTMSCTARPEKFDNSEGPTIYKAWMDCSSDGRSGYISYEGNYDRLENEDTVTYVIESTSGKKIAKTRSGKEFREIYGGRIGDIANGISLTEKGIRDLGWDPNEVGNTKLTVSKFELSRSRVLVDSKGHIVTRKQAVAKSDDSGKCIYIDSANVIQGQKGKLLCSDTPSVCSATVECKDPAVGWVTRSIVCKTGNDNSCPTDANDCFGDKSLENKVAKIGFNNQPLQREKSKAAQ